MPGKPPRVSLHLGLTKSIGNYESLRIDIGYERDVEEDVETPDGAYEKCMALVLKNLQKQLGVANQALDLKVKPTRRF